MRAVFLDRDGVLNREVGNLSRVEQLQLLPGVSGAVRKLNELDIPVIVVTNQSAVGRGLCSEAELGEIHVALAELLAAGGASVARFCYCPHHPTEGIGPYRMECECRKPKPGMLRQAAKDLGIDLTRSAIVGDHLSDLQAGWTAGCRTVLVTTGRGLETRKNLAGHPRQPDHIADGLAGAVDWILGSFESANDGVSVTSGRRPEQ